jgi:hypothetical protein
MHPALDRANTIFASIRGGTRPQLSLLARPKGKGFKFIANLSIYILVATPFHTYNFWKLAFIIFPLLFLLHPIYSHERDDLNDRHEATQLALVFQMRPSLLGRQCRVQTRWSP